PYNMPYIGPFNSFDNFLVPVPPTLKALYFLFRMILNTARLDNVDGFAVDRPFLAISKWSAFNDTAFLGGNPTDPVYSILGWAYLLDWVEGSREVVSFAGDVATLRLILYPYDVASSVDSTVLNSNALPRSIATLFGFGVWYVSWMFGIAEFCMVGVAAFYSFQISGHNMLFFHRVAGPIWIWWPFLFLRGLTAVILLSSSSPDMVQQHGLSTLVNRPHTFLSSLIFFEQLHRRSPTSEWWMDAASNVMCGMILITFRGVHYIFDVKSWNLLCLSPSLLKKRGSVSTFIAPIL
ncbi:hypothetical protein DYB28_008329, partial [Aphanomyces astaci]